MTYKKKLIEVAIPLAKINAESAREKSIRHGHPSTLHLWWARRPLAAARAVLFAQLVDDPSALPEQFPTEEAQEVERKRLFDIIERLVVWENTNDQALLAEAHAEILKSCDGDLPNVLDPFGGGGAIPLESLRLGLPTFTGDLNPVAVLIQRAMLEIPQRFGGNAPVHPDARVSQALWAGAEGLAADVEAYGRWMQQEAKSRIGKYYPDVELDDGSKAIPIAWIWARSVKSPDPSWPGHVPLVRSWVLSKKPGKPTVWVEPVVDRDAKTISYEVRTGGEPGVGTIERGVGTCVATGASIPGDYIKLEGVSGRIANVALAVVVESSSGRVYVSSDGEYQQDLESKILWRPTGAMSDHPQYMGTVRYGFDEWAKLYTDRQLLALTTFSDLLGEVRDRVEADAREAGLNHFGPPIRDGGSGSVAYADAVLTYLAFVIDKCADYWSSICSWINNGETIRNTFARQAIPMTWDYAEVNPFSSSTGNWMSMVDWVVRSIRHLPADGEGQTVQRDARARITEVGKCLISTDPPYYDNVPYSDISDFFYVWLRKNLAGIWPDETSTLLTPKADELVANQYRAGSRAAANELFESGMAEVFACAAENSDERFPAAVYYAFKASDDSSDGVISTGWETFLSGLLRSGYMISATWPVRTERATRMRSHASNALATSVVLACRPREISAGMATRGEFIGALRAEMIPSVRLLQKENIAPVDMAQSAMGPGIAIFSRYPKVVEADGSSMSVRTALALINEVLAEALSGEESEFDADTRFAVTWFEQFGHNPGPAGDAITLATAKNTSVAGVETSGIASSRDGKFRLLDRGELDEGWDPANDSRLTVWEATQYLIRALDNSETAASDLLRRIGQGFGERARQLAYLLYGICDRNKWANEASAYNMLVTAWPEIERLAALTSVDEPTTDDRLF